MRKEQNKQKEAGIGPFLKTRLECLLSKIMNHYFN